MADEPNPKTDETNEPPPKKKKTLLFAIIGGTIILLGGGGFFAYTQFLAPKPAIEQEQTADTKTKPPETIGEMFKLDPFVVNLSDAKGKRYLKLRLEIELKDDKSLEKATKLTPKLRDLVIMMLTSLSFEDVMTPEGKIRIRDELLERFNQVMKPDMVTNIYFTDFVVQ